MTPRPTKANAVIFLRARTLTATGRDRISEEQAIAHQRWACQQTAARLDVTIVKEYVEYGGTGAVTSRPVLRRMLGDLRTLLGVSYVLVAGLDRLARIPTDLRQVKHEIQAAGAQLMETSGLLPVAYHCNPDESLTGLAPTD